MVAINNASPAIQWQCIKKHSAFLHKRRGGTNKWFSLDPFNLTKQYSIRSSGLVNKLGVSVRVADDNKGLIVETKKAAPGAANKPVSATTTVKVGNSPAAAIKAVGKIVHSYSSRHETAACRRASQLLRSIHPRKRSGKARRTNASLA